MTLAVKLYNYTLLGDEKSELLENAYKSALRSSSTRTNPV
jgi:hypothetical protein